MEDDEYLSVDDVAKVAKVEAQTVREWIKAGKLRATKPGREYRIKRSWLDAMLKEYEVTE